MIIMIIKITMIIIINPNCKTPKQATEVQG